MVNFCHACGSQILPDARFCSNCGESLIEAQSDVQTGGIQESDLDWSVFYAIMSDVLEAVRDFSFAIEDRQKRGLFSLFIGKGFGGPAQDLAKMMEDNADRLLLLGEGTFNLELKEQCSEMTDTLGTVSYNAHYIRTYCDIPVHENAVYDALDDIINFGKQLQVMLS